MDEEQKSAICLGAGVTGISCARFLAKKGWRVVLTDDCPEKALEKPQVRELLQNRLVTFCTVEEICRSVESTLPLSASLPSCVVTSPGVSLAHPLVLLARDRAVPVASDIEIGLQFFRANRPRLIGITGSNGKTTVTLLLTHILKYAGLDAVAVGNVGNAFLDHIDGPENRILVVELSSQQLKNIRTPYFDAGCILNISPNHLDWHPSMDDYALSKISLASLMQRGVRSFYVGAIPPLYHASLPRDVQIVPDVASLSDLHIRKRLTIFGEEITLSEPLLASPIHDLQNFLFACCLAKECGVPFTKSIDAFETFVKPPHRIQFIKMHHGISYYDDSKATSVDAVIRAVKSVPGPIVLIAGGVHKGASYSEWITPFKERVLKVFAIGEASPIIERDLAPHIEVVSCKTLDDAFFSASLIAKEGGSVLLSPGCSSWDMFANYKERGQKFQHLVSTLAET